MEICEFCHWLTQQCTCDKQVKALIKQLRAENAVLAAQQVELEQLRKENKKLLWTKEEQLALTDIINAVANETTLAPRTRQAWTRLILAKNRGEVDHD